MIKNILVTLFTLIALGACSPGVHTKNGKNFTVTDFNNIVPGKTTKNALLTSLGNPQQKGIQSSGKESWTYSYFSIDAPSQCLFTTAFPKMEHDYKELKISFDGDTVADKSYDMTRKPTKKYKK